MEPLIYKGKYTDDCKVFTHDVEESAISQLYGFLNHPAADGMKVRIMPDIHAGSGCVIGFTSTFNDKVIPNLVGVDINCGVLSYALRRTVKEDINFDEFDNFIRNNIPYGFGKNDNLKEWMLVPKNIQSEILRVAKETNQELDYVKKSMASLGGGNHFHELNQGLAGDIYITVHSGSRNFGLKVCNYHQKIAKKKNSFGGLSYL